MTIELPKEVRAEAIKSIERYFEVHMEERMQMRATELDIECHEDEFRYWQKFDRKR